MTDKDKSAAQVGKSRSAEGRPEASALLRPDIGAQSQFRKKKPVAYRCDSSLSPALDRDGLNPAGEHGQTAVEAVDDRGNGLMAVKPLSDAEVGT